MVLRNIPILPHHYMMLQTKDIDLNARYRLLYAACVCVLLS